MNAQYILGQKVNLVILRKTDLGFVAKINQVDEGLLYHSEIFELLRPGQECPGYIKKIREDGMIDLQLQPFGSLGAKEHGVRILSELTRQGGFLPINDKTSSEIIHKLFGLSKKKYKIALGGLYKAKQITVNYDGIRLVTTPHDKNVYWNLD
jgi:predicted RNA-binding protein (virulence factor B family)